MKTFTREQVLCAIKKHGKRLTIQAERHFLGTSELLSKRVRRVSKSGRCEYDFADLSSTRFVPKYGKKSFNFSKSCFMAAVDDPNSLIEIVNAMFAYDRLVGIRIVGLKVSKPKARTPEVKAQRIRRVGEKKKALTKRSR